MIRDFTVKRGFIPEDLDVRTRGWLRVAEQIEHDSPYTFTPFKRVAIDVASIDYDETELHLDWRRGKLQGETRVIFTGQVALDGALHEVEGFYYRSGQHRIGHMSATEQVPFE